MKKLNWGILSTAKIAEKSYVPAIRDSRNGQLYAVASRSVEKAERFATEHGFEKAYGTYEALLEDPKVEAIYLPLPTSMHAEWAIKCLEAGKPVLCEKPFAQTVEQAEWMVEASRKSGVALAEAVMYRYHPVTRRVVKLLREGAIGEVRVIDSCFHGVAFNAENFRFDKSLGGGALLDLGIYCVNVSRLLSGEEPSQIGAVGTIGETGVDEVVAAGLRFPSGKAASFSCSMRTEFDCWYRVTGTEGRLEVPTGGMLTGPNREYSILIRKGGETEEITIPKANHYQLMAEAFADTVLNGTPLEWPPEDAIANMRVIEAILGQIFRD